MKNEFTDAMSERTNEELIKIVTTDRDKYQALALEAADLEFKNRALDEALIKEVEEKATIEKSKTQEVESNLVSTGIRLLNYIIDTIFSFILAMIVVSIYQFIIPPSQSLISMLMPGILLLLSIFAYYVIMEIMFQKTIGKFITNTKVVTLNGDAPKQSDIIARSFCRFIPFDHISYLFMKNGFHDLLSKTKVIKDQKK